ncbi:hypothetical protein [Tropicimonas sp. S265A]|uniref:hypothetical protein n=1 Tax=Tropicimonas sp. S265A TaxID=3415134 RepID=UPI003C7EAF0A
MFELKKQNTNAKAFLSAVFSHRVLYASLAFCHASGCVVTEKPELYGPMAVLYGILSVRG